MAGHYTFELFCDISTDIEPAKLGTILFCLRLPSIWLHFCMLHHISIYLLDGRAIAGVNRGLSWCVNIWPLDPRSPQNLSSSSLDSVVPKAFCYVFKVSRQPRLKLIALLSYHSRNKYTGSACRCSIAVGHKVTTWNSVALCHNKQRSVS